MSPVDAWASERHFWDHISPIWDALGEHRGRFWTKGGWGDTTRTQSPSRGANPIIVASYADSMSVRFMQRPTILLEHGAGQTYGSEHQANPGGKRRENISLFLCPNERVARLNREAYPDTPSVVVGSPRLDRWAHKPPPEDDVIAIAWHWDNRSQEPEARTALPFYREHLPALRDAFGGRIIGHGHPRAWRTLKPMYERFGIEPVEELDEVFRRTRMLIFDNSSIGYEIAALDRPVLVLNCPHYRRSVNWGLRFWDTLPGMECDNPEMLVLAAQQALANRGWAQEVRHKAIERVFPLMDGLASQRAVAAILAL